MGKSEKFWDRMSGGYDRGDDGAQEGEFPSVVTTRRYLNEDDVVLDFGCATGTLALKIAGDVKEVYGVDISSKMIAIARNKALEQGVENARFAQATLQDNDLEAGSFDVILVFNVLHLLEDTETSLRGLGDLLKPGGLLITDTPCLGEKMAFLGGIFKVLNKLGLMPAVTRLKINELEDYLSDVGFEILEQEIFGDGVPSLFVVARKVAKDDAGRGQAE